MPAEEFRQYGHQLIDWIADFLANVGNLPVFPNVQPGEICGKLPNAPPIKGEGMDEILADVERVIMPGMTHWNHPVLRACAHQALLLAGVALRQLGGVRIWSRLLFRHYRWQIYARELPKPELEATHSS